MAKTKPSVGQICVLAVVAAVALSASAFGGGCAQHDIAASPAAVTSFRPNGAILAIRMTPYHAQELNFRSGKAIRRVPGSMVKWRVESVLHDVLGASGARLVRVRVDVQSAEITGTIPTGWQARDIRERLQTIDVLRAATIEWRVLDPHAARPSPDAPNDAQSDEQLK
jgi:hypothetical protein